MESLIKAPILDIERSGIKWNEVFHCVQFEWNEIKKCIKNGM